MIVRHPSVVLFVVFAALGLSAAERLTGISGARFSLREAHSSCQWICVVDPGPRQSYTTGDARPDERTGRWSFSFGEAAVSNLETYVRQILTHRNVHTGRDYAHEPALAWYCIVNEGNPGNFGLRYVKDIPEFRTEWTAWLKGRKSADPAYADIPEDFPQNISSLDRHAAAYRQFLAFLARRPPSGRDPDRALGGWSARLRGKGLS